MKSVAAVLLLLCAAKHIGYEHFAAEDQALAWNALGALTTSILLVMVWRENRSPVVGLVVLWWLYEEALVGACSVWRIVDWWPVAEGEQQCSARLGIHAGIFSLIAIGAVLARISSEPGNRQRER